jgi:hypothetical protein
VAIKIPETPCDARLRAGRPRRDYGRGGAFLGDAFPKGGGRPAECRSMCETGPGRFHHPSWPRWLSQPLPAPTYLTLLSSMQEREPENVGAVRLLKTRQEALTGPSIRYSQRPG